MNRVFRIAATCALVAPALWAADAASKRATGCRVLLVSGEIKEPWYRKSERDEYVPVVISTDFLSATIPVPAGAKLAFYRKLSAPAKDASGKTVQYAPVCEFALGTASRQLLLILDSDGKWTGRAFPDEDQAFPNGTKMIFNFSGSPVAFDFGGTRLALNPGAHGVLGAPKAMKDNCAPIKAMRMTASGPKAFFDYAWPWYPDQRNILFVLDRPGDQLTIKGVDDAREPESKPAGGRAK